MYIRSLVLRQQISDRLASCLSKRNLSYGTTRTITSHTFEKFHHNQHRHQQLQPILSTQTLGGHFSYRFYSKKSSSNFNDKPQSSSANDGDDDGNDEGYHVSDTDWSDSDEYWAENNEKTDLTVPDAVPEIFPRVPLIATKYPIFPKFTKILEVTDPKLIQRLEWSVRTYAPYAGVFVLKDPESETTNVTDIKQVHQVGTFIKIGEMERRGNKLLLIATGHRRIKIIRSIDPEKLQAADEKALEKQGGEKGAEKKPGHPKEKKGDYVRVKHPPPVPPATVDAGTDKPKDDGLPVIQMVETENMMTSKVDKQSTEYKAITLEIVSTIRHIITENPFIQETVKQMLGENLNVADNPAYLADLAAAITSARPAELQEIVEEEDVNLFVLFFFLSKNYYLKLITSHFRVLRLAFRL